MSEHHPHIIKRKIPAQKPNATSIPLNNTLELIARVEGPESVNEHLRALARLALAEKSAPDLFVD